MEVVNMRDKVSKDHIYMKKQEPILQEIIHNTSPPPTTTASPSSPANEFSFTISLNPQPPPKSTQHAHKHNTYINHNHHHQRYLTPPPEPPLTTAMDLSPADDIFFHGQLLPLHHLSPRSSTNSMDGFTLPMKEILNDQNNPTGNTSFHYHHRHRNTFSNLNIPRNNVIQTRPKSKSFSIFSIPKWKKESPNEGNNTNSKKNLKLEVGQLIKRYMNMIKPFISFSKTKRSNNNTECNRQSHSFSGKFLNRGGVLRRGRFSSPASIRTSPANSGILVGSGAVSPAKSIASDSTMEELQAAIQAAIAHCKNSIASEDHKVQALK